MRYGSYGTSVQLAQHKSEVPFILDALNSGGISTIWRSRPSSLTATD